MNGGDKYSDLSKTQQLFNGMKFQMSPKEDCLSCLRGKMSRRPFKSSYSRSKEILEVVHSDLCGPMEEPSISGA